MVSGQEWSAWRIAPAINFGEHEWSVDRIQWSVY